MLLLELLEPQRRALGEEDPGTLRSMNELAHLYHLQGRHEEAESLYRKTLEARQRVIGPTDRGMLWTMKLLIDLLRSMGREVEADSLTTERVARWKEAAESPNANAEAKAEYAWLLLTCEPVDLQDPQEALRFALAACEQTDFANPNWLDTLALAYHRTGQTATAIETQKNAIALLVEEAPGDSRLTEFEERLVEFEAAMKRVGR